jgi:succinoglycan biosynthesis protein ExoA
MSRNSDMTNQSSLIPARIVQRPRISVIVPARNEEAHIEQCIRSIREQDVEGGLELIVADGSSTDRTVSLARGAGAIVVDNPSGAIPTGLNAGLSAARGEVVVRFDAHAVMPPGYIQACLRALDEEPGAVCVGGWRRVESRGPWGRATAAALASRLGVGNPRIWRRPGNGDGRVDLETVPLGCWTTDALRRAGGWNRRYLRNEDFELNHRLRRAGGRIVFDPAIWSIYKPRERLPALARQYLDYGRAKALMMLEAPESLRPRQVAPLGLAAAAAAALGPRTPVRVPGRALLAAYALLVTAVALRSPEKWRTAAVLVTMHAAWGAGVVVGLAGNVATRLHHLLAATPRPREASTP